MKKFVKKLQKDECIRKNLTPEQVEAIGLGASKKALLVWSCGVAFMTLTTWNIAVSLLTAFFMAAFLIPAAKNKRVMFLEIAEEFVKEGRGGDLQC
ncbi:MAG: hypothetical protein P1U36_10460 [Legionellaceae bacterium]|nr:hypothetical protein [Legionellaceae bacterium]